MAGENADLAAEAHRRLYAPPMTTQVELTFLLIGFGMSWVVGAAAARKGYSRDLWAFYGLVLWPVALGVVLAKPRNPWLFRRCPDCGADDVPFDAPVCRHCRRDERLTA